MTKSGSGRCGEHHHADDRSEAAGDANEIAAAVQPADRKADADANRMLSRDYRAPYVVREKI